RYAEAPQEAACQRGRPQPGEQSIPRRQTAAATQRPAQHAIQTQQRPQRQIARGAGKQLVAVEGETLAETRQALREFGQAEETPRCADAVEGQDDARELPQSSRQPGQSA